MKLKKILCIALTILMMSSTLSLLSVSAADGPAAALEGNLIMHWDFEGDTLEEQLANKAVNGNATDALEFDNVGEHSSIEDGVANISGKFDNQLVFNGNGVKGAKLNECANEYTFFVRCNVSPDGEFQGGTYPYSLFWVQGTNVQVVRMVAQPWGAKVGPRFIVNGLEDTLSSLPADTYWYFGEFSDIAVTVKKLDNGKCKFTLYSGTTITEWTTTKNQLAGSDLMNSFAQFVFASGKKHNSVAGSDNYYVEFTKDVAYDDIRVYNKALTFDEIKKVSYEVSGIDPDETVDLGEFTFADDQTTTTTAGGDTTTAAGGDTTTANADNATTSEVEVKVGCGSAILGMALIPTAVAVGAVAVSRKKRS